MSDYFCLDILYRVRSRIDIRCRLYPGASRDFADFEMQNTHINPYQVHTETHRRWLKQACELSVRHEGIDWTLTSCFKLSLLCERSIRDALSQIRTKIVRPDMEIQRCLVGPTSSTARAWPPTEEIPQWCQATTHQQVHSRLWNSVQKSDTDIEQMQKRYKVCHNPLYRFAGMYYSTGPL